MTLIPGMRLGRLQLLNWVRGTKRTHGRWRCRCDCGKITLVAAHNLQRTAGATRSCGCLAVELTRARSITHGARIGRKFTPEYRAWTKMRERCEHPSDSDARLYLGIRVCARWRGRHGFENFLADMGPRPHGMTLDRRDNDGNYEPGNCRWATPRQQARNRRTNRMVTFKRQTRCVAEWAEILDLNPDTLRSRLNAGWNTAEAFGVAQ